MGPVPQGWAGVGIRLECGLGCRGDEDLNSLPLKEWVAREGVGVSPRALQKWEKLLSEGTGMTWLSFLSKSHQLLE